MKLIKIEIVNFGQFSNFTLDLPSSGLNVFFGANEAGKSTIVAFIKQVMFGFHLAKHTSDFFEDYKPLARVSPMGGSLFFENEDGQHYQLERLYASGKGSKVGTLTVKCDKQVVPEQVFFDQIKNIDGNFYADSFIFNQDMLAKVNKLQQTDLLERIYYLGAANSDQLIDLRDDFAKNASELFKKGGSRPPLNRLLKQLQEERVKVEEAEGEFTAYQAASAELQQQKKEQSEAEKQLTELQKEHNHLAQLQKSLPNYQQLLELKKQVKPVNFDQKQYQAARELSLRIDSLQENVQNLHKRLAQIDQAPQADLQMQKLQQKKPDLLQWQSEYRACMQKDQEIARAQEQQLTLNPDLTKIVHKDQEAIVALQKDYQSLPVKEENPQVEQSNAMRPLYFLGGGLVVVGLILLATVSIIAGIIVAASGLGCFYWAQVKQKEARSKQDATRKEQEARQAQRNAFTEKYGLDPDHLDLHNLLAEWRQYQVQEQKRQSNQKRANELLANLTQLAKQTSAVLNQQVKADFTEVRRALEQVDKIIAQQNRQEDERNNLHDQLTANENKLREVKLQLKAALAQAQVEGLTEYQNLQEQSQKQEAIKTKIALLTTNLGQDLPLLADLAQDADQAQDQINALAQKISTVQETIRHLQDKGAEIKVRLANLANSNAVFAAKQELANTKTKFYNLSTEYLANLAASAWIGRALDLASNNRFPKMLAAAQEYLRLLTNNRYNSIELDKNLTVTRFDGKKIKVQYLSRGTSEQLYFALKLAFVEQIKDQINLPILIDDSFVNFDDQRTGQINELLKQVAQNNQVLIFTAQTSLVDRLHIQPLTLVKGTENV